MNEMSSLLERADKYLQSARLLLKEEAEGLLKSGNQFVENVRQYLTRNGFV